MTLLDPHWNEPVLRQTSDRELNGTSASLGVLMGNVFRRTSGRGWRLRRRSMQLWPRWVQALQAFETGLTLQTGLLQIAADRESATRMGALAEQRSDLGLELQTSEQVRTIWPTALHGALHSRADGRINPLQLQIALRRALLQESVQPLATRVVQLERDGSRWRVHHAEGGSTCHDCVVICSGLSAGALLEPLGHSLPLSPVLGQALSLQLKEGPTTWIDWPAVLIDQSFNLIPDGPGRLLLGATVEPGTEAADNPLALMRTLNDNAPEWLRSASVIEHWSGLRARPVERPAPLLNVLEPGLIVASGHYRNGVLLAPATAEWISTALQEP